MHNKPHSPEAKKKMSDARRGKPAPWRHRPSKMINGYQHWRCGRCGEFFLRSGFYKNNRTLLGIKSECKQCHSEGYLRSRDPVNTRRLKKESEARRRARKAGTRDGLTSEALAELERTWGDRCLCCGGTKNLQWDHVVPLSRGGVHTAGNLQRLCRYCNEHKQARARDYRIDAQKVWAIGFERKQAR